MARQAGRNVELETQTQAPLRRPRAGHDPHARRGRRTRGRRRRSAHTWRPETTHVWKHRFIEFLAFGTAIEPLEGETDPLPLSLSVSIDR